eukprot:TRINITY_DN44171_c0_g1_i1.p1 TRINITY_DN44171_c0_g1~~TRINITY_DN44171_c0_g1_i1.p1  ORF type:complete len:275 (+),score=45.18 TRINITY_DN44171_c0_g1_i1:50-874(+)
MGGGSSTKKKYETKEPKRSSNRPEALPTVKTAFEETDPAPGAARTKVQTLETPTPAPRNSSKQRASSNASNNVDTEGLRRSSKTRSVSNGSTSIESEAADRRESRRSPACRSSSRSGSKRVSIADMQDPNNPNPAAEAELANAVAKLRGEAKSETGDDRQASKGRSDKRKGSRSSTLQRINGMSIADCEDPNVNRFKVGDRVMGLGKAGLTYGVGTVAGLWEEKTGTLRVLFDMGKELPIKGQNLKYIDAKTDTMMKGMGPKELKAFLGDGWDK